MGISVTRRGFCSLLLVLTAPGARDATAARRVLARPAPAAVMRALVDTLLPDAELDGSAHESASSGGLSLGTDLALLRAGAEDAALANLIIRGTDWLQAQARERGDTDFASLDEVNREAVIAAAERAPADSLQHRFFTAMRHLAFRHYYAQAAAWVGLGYTGPPQPLGFPDHATPPERGPS